MSTLGLDNTLENIGDMGKHKYIETPEKLWELFLAYKKEVKDNPRIKVEYVGKEGETKHTPLERPLIMVGFESYVMEHTRITYPDLTEYFEGKNDSYKGYFPISTRIKKEIEAEQVDGGMTGMYNASLTGRINGITDKQEIKTETSISILNIDPLAD